MASVSKIAPELRALHAPAPLRELNGWLCWRYETYEGEPKPRKVPMWADGSRRHGQQGSSVDRARLTTFTAAREAAIRKGFDGVGFALLADWGITALDFDNCVGPDGSLPPEIEAIAARTYTEFSPSGKGIRAFLRGNLGNHKTKTTADAYGLETFSSSGFVTCTGDMLPGIELVGHEDVIAPVSQDVVDLCERRFGAPAASQLSDDFTAGWEPRLGLTAEQMQDMLDCLDPGMGRGDWLAVGMALHHETEGGEDGFDLWNDWSSSAHNYVSEEDLRYAWDKFHEDGSGRRRVTMASVIKMANDARQVVTVEDAVAKADAMVADLPPPAGVATPEGFTGKFKVQAAAALAGQKPTRWLIKGVVPEADLIVLYGASGSGKSFVSLEMGCAIARGEPWRGRKTLKGNVVVVAAEGGGGYGKRVQAYCAQHMIDAAALPVGVINAAPNVLEADDIIELTAAIRAVGGVRLIIIDTFAQVTPGANENGSEQMGRALANARVLRQATGASIMLIHHAGKDAARGARGWSGIKAAADAEIEVSRDEDSGAREIRLSKMKDGDDGLRWGFRLDVVTLGLDEDGDAITSCVVSEAEVAKREAPEDRRNIKRRGKLENHVLDTIAMIPAATDTINLQQLITMAVNGMPAPEDGKRDTRRQRIAVAVKSLANEKTDAPIQIAGNVVVLCTE